MTTEEFQKIVLQKFDQNDQFQKLVLEKITTLHENLSNVQKDLTSVQKDLSTVQADLDTVKEQTKENTDFIKALLHRTEELEAKYDGLFNITATKESVERIEAKLDKILATQIVQGESINILAMRQLRIESNLRYHC